MAKRSSARSRKQPNNGGWLLTALVLLLAGTACFVLTPPAPEDLAAVFGHDKPASAANEAVTLLPHDWYVVEADGQAVAALGELLEAEILRAVSGDSASIRRVSTEEIALRFTASATQLTALRQSADALEETLATLSRMAHLSPYDAANASVASALNLDALVASLDNTLNGVENPIVRGLAGLVGSCREAMASLSTDASVQNVQKKHAALVLQYESYAAYITQAATVSASPMP